MFNSRHFHKCKYSTPETHKIVVVKCQNFISQAATKNIFQFLKFFRKIELNINFYTWARTSTHTPRYENNKIFVLHHYLFASNWITSSKRNMIPKRIQNIRQRWDTISLVCLKIEGGKQLNHWSILNLIRSCFRRFYPDAISHCKNFLCFPPSCVLWNFSAISTAFDFRGMATVLLCTETRSKRKWFSFRDSVQRFLSIDECPCRLSWSLWFVFVWLLFIFVRWPSSWMGLSRVKCNAPLFDQICRKKVVLLCSNLWYRYWIVAPIFDVYQCFQ